MTKSSKNADARTRLIHTAVTRVQDLAEAGAEGRALTPAEVRAVCQALRAQGTRARNQFHSGV